MGNGPPPGKNIPQKNFKQLFVFSLPHPPGKNNPTVQNKFNNFKKSSSPTKQILKSIFTLNKKIKNQLT